MAATRMQKNEGGGKGFIHQPAPQQHEWENNPCDRSRMGLPSQGHETIRLANEI
jgi:hypothetical protein